MLTVNDLMTVRPCTVGPDTPLRYVIRFMKGEGCRQLPVVDRGKLVGIISVTDFLDCFAEAEAERALVGT